jgi:hypothetical protein
MIAQPFQQQQQRQLLAVLLALDVLEPDRGMTMVVDG